MVPFGVFDLSKGKDRLGQSHSTTQHLSSQRYIDMHIRLKLSYRLDDDRVYQVLCCEMHIPP